MIFCGGSHESGCKHNSKIVRRHLIIDAVLVDTIYTLENEEGEGEEGEDGEEEEEEGRGRRRRRRRRGKRSGRTEMRGK